MYFFCETSAPSNSKTEVTLIMKAGNVTNDQLLGREFAPFSCDEPTKPENCPGNVCQFTVDNEDIIGPIDYRMHICPLSCPRNFPWLNNPLGM